MCQSPPEPTLNSAPVRAEDALCGIVRRMAVRDPRSLDAFFHAFSPVLMGVAVQMLGSRSDAEEVLQDTLVRVWEKAPAFDPLRSRAGTWALMILRGLCLDRLRSRRRRLNPLPLEADWDAAAGNGTFDPALVADVRAAWDGLAAADRVLLGRAVFSPDTAQQMAAASGEPVGTIKARIHRAMHRFFNSIHGRDDKTDATL